jgi:ABC-type transport system involved in cytochrome c biogenesis ATPase subunit
MYEELSVAENLQFWGRACGAKNSEIAASLRRAEVSQRLEPVPFAQLSSGQRRRVSLAAMLVKRATLWCLDEPHAGMDAPGRDLVDGLLLEARDSGVTTLIASHDADRVASLATDRVWVQGGAISSDSGLSEGQTTTSNNGPAEP